MNIRILSPAGHVATDVVSGGVETLRSWGHHVTVAPHALTQYGRYAATPADRAADLLDALRAPAVDLLWCARGGYGCMHLLDLLPLDIIADSHKSIVGYSDITALHALWQRAGIRSLHAPMMKHLSASPLHPTSLSLRRWLDALSASANEVQTALALTFAPHSDNQMGVAVGRLIGGNLAVLSALHGTPYDFDYRDALLFIEDIGESPYKIDRMIQTLRLSGVFEQLKGLIVVQFSGCVADPLLPEPLAETIRHAVGDRIPVAFNVPVGHVTENYPLMEGATYHLSVTEQGTAIIPSLF
jgi:muramoyltetrapeptide carboxypeptidase